MLALMNGVNGHPRHFRLFSCSRSVPYFVVEFWQHETVMFTYSVLAAYSSHFAYHDLEASWLHFSMNRSSFEFVIL